jgi:hypothetical protein
MCQKDHQSRESRR